MTQEQFSNLLLLNIEKKLKTKYVVVQSICHRRREHVIDIDSLLLCPLFE